MKEMFILDNPRRKGRRRRSRRTARARFHRNPRRRRSGGRRRGRSRSMARAVRSSGGASISSPISAFRSLTRKDVIMTALGIAAGTLVTRWVVKQFRGKLPLLTNADGSPTTFGPLLYNVGIPILAGVFAGRLNKSFGTGLMLSGAATGAREVLDRALPAAVTGTSAYVNAGLRGLGRLPGPRNHTAVDQFSSMNTLRKAGPMVFSSNAFAKH